MDKSLKQRKTPLRMCVNCREMKPKKELLRIVKSASGDVNIDLTGKMPGRGAYVCKEEECVKTAKKQRKIERTFGGANCGVIYETLLEMSVYGSLNKPASPGVQTFEEGLDISDGG